MICGGGWGSSFDPLEMLQLRPRLVILGLDPRVSCNVGESCFRGNDGDRKVGFTHRAGRK